jgi:uncharacterized protein YecT (DUF1311 family)
MKSIVASISLVLLLFLSSSLLAAETPACKPVTIDDIPTKDKLADKQDLTSLLGKYDSSDYYYGLGVPVDYQKARYAAIDEMQSVKEKDMYFMGSAVLIMLYANGYGVKQDIDLAIRLADCNLDQDAMAYGDSKYRIEHLNNIKSGNDKKPFDICDDCAANEITYHCSGLKSEILNNSVQKDLNKIRSAYDDTKKAAFDNISKTVSEFIDKRVANEVDLSGRDRDIFEDDEFNTQTAYFLSSIQDFEQGKLPFYTEKDLRENDKGLNENYTKIMNNKNFNYGTVTKDNIKTVEKVWMKYRDAWAKYGVILYPKSTAISWKTWATKTRTEQLKDFVEYGETK